MVSRRERKEGATSPVPLLYERHAVSIAAYIRARAPTREDAEDLLLEVFLATHEHVFLLECDEAQQLSWLRRIAHNKCVDFYRRAQRHPQVSLEENLALGNIQDPFDEAVSSLPEQAILRNEEHARLYTHLATLPREHYEVLHLRFSCGMRCVDIARKLQTPEGTVRSWLSRSLNALRTLYERQEADHDLDG
jgi:RNA polymerase sigma factor (sigma-70 family)